MVGDNVPVRPASTVMLVRDGAHGLEVFTLLRAASMVFGPGMTVFPGGGVTGADADPAVPWRGPAADWWASQWHLDVPEARAHIVAAVRELFEEVGVLLAGPLTDPADIAGQLSGPLAEQLAARRQALARHDMALSQVLTEYSWDLRADVLKSWSRWITPVGPPRRYDTQFFIAALPAGQDASLLTTEATVGEWQRPGVVLDGYRAGNVFLMPPTISTLEDLAAMESVATLLRQQREVRPIMPEVLTADGEVLRVRVDGREFTTRLRPLDPPRP